MAATATVRQSPAAPVGAFVAATSHFRFETKIISRQGNKGAMRSAAGAVAYRAGLDLVDERTGELQAYSARNDVLRDQTVILAPDASPAWLFDPAELARQVDKVEVRKDAQLFRELVIDLPVELDLEQQMGALHSFLRQRVVSMGMAATVNVHEKQVRGSQSATCVHRHAHVLLTMRPAGPAGFGKKDRSWNDRGLTEKWRYDWQDEQNRALERAGRPERCSAASIREQAAAQGLDPDDPDHSLLVPIPQPKRGADGWRGYGSKETWQAWEEAEADRKAALAAREELFRTQAALQEAVAAAEAETKEALDRIQEQAAAAVRDRIEREREDADDEAKAARVRAEGERLGEQVPHPWAQVPACSIGPTGAHGIALWSQIKTGDLEGGFNSLRVDADVRYLRKYWHRRQLPDGSLEFYNKAGSFVDHGTHLSAKSGNDREIEAMIRLARAKGWSAISVTGSEDFKLRAMTAALEAGLIIVPRSGEDSEMLARARRHGEPTQPALTWDQYVTKSNVPWPKEHAKEPRPSPSSEKPKPSNEPTQQALTWDQYAAKSKRVPGPKEPGREPAPLPSSGKPKPS